MGGFLLVLLVVVILAGLAWFGYEFGREKASEGLAGERDELDTQRQVLDIEWTALEQARRVNDVFFWARDELRRAESEAGRPPRPGTGYDPPPVVDGSWE